MTMIRKQIYIEKKHDQQLKRLAKARGVSEAEVIRQAIEREAQAAAEDPQAARQKALAEFLEAARVRKELGITGEPYKWNREEIYEERLARFGRSE
jgi:hypothetical protein